MPHKKHDEKHKKDHHEKKEHEHKAKKGKKHSSGMVAIKAKMSRD